MADAPLSPAEAARWTRIGALSALAMLLGYLESFLPIPLPGVKLGLANIAVLVALGQRDLQGAFFVGLVKVLATGLLFGNPVTLAYSATGTLFAFVLMAPLALLPTMRLWMVSVVGALAHEAGQLLVAQLLLGTPLVWYAAPVLAVAGCVTGLLCGVAAERTASLLEADAVSDAVADDAKDARGNAAGNAKETGAEVRPGVARQAAALLALYLGFVVVTMHARDGRASVACLVAALAACAAARLRPRDLGAALAPALPLALVALMAQVANNQQGTVLLALGPVALTREALGASWRMLARLVSISCASVAVVRRAGREGLARVARGSLRPLRALGMRTAGPELAFACTIRLISALADDLPRIVRPGALLTGRFWREELPALARDLYRATR